MAQIGDTGHRNDIEISLVTPAAPPVTRIVTLDHPAASNPEISGAKAAALARALQRGLPVINGFVITTSAAAEIPLTPSRLAAKDNGGLRSAWDQLSQAGRIPLAVRSSSVAEDGESSSMAGMFTSVIGVCGWTAFCRAVIEVVLSARPQSKGPEPAPIAVLVQPVVEAVAGGVMFGVDPVSGRRDRLVVAAVEGGPQPLVSGEVDGNKYTLSRQGRVLGVDTGTGGATLGGRRRRALAHLAARTFATFGSPQDDEWAFDSEDRLWLLQSRPVTALTPQEEAQGPVFGPGPIAETFPAPLSPLEQELWLDPMREAITEALMLLRGAPRKRIASSPVLITVAGRAAADLELLGVAPGKRSWIRQLDPRPPARRLLASWDAGRLRAALPALAATSTNVIDRELESIPPVSEMDPTSLVELMRRCMRALKGLHGHEVIAGMLLSGEAPMSSGAAQGLRALVAGRRDGLSDAEIVARHPIVLTLTSPTAGPPAPLPPAPSVLPIIEPDEDELAHAREVLRVRARWVQELGAVAARELGRRLAGAGALGTAADIRYLTLEEIQRQFDSGAAPGVAAESLAELRAATAGAPLPAAFRLTTGKRVVAVDNGPGPNGGIGAGGGRAKGRVVHDPKRAGAGDVLVVRTLDPDLASVLPPLAGLVSETGSVLSHLAILAREFNVPTVVSFKNAVERWAEGAVVVVDGATGTVDTLSSEAAA